MAMYANYWRIVEWPLDLLGRAERSTLHAGLWRAEGAGLDDESVDRAII
jgi:hypothetical protein